MRVCRVCLVGSVLLMDDAKDNTLPLLSNGGQDVAISMDGIGIDKQRYQQQLHLIDEQVSLLFTLHQNVFMPPPT